MAPPDGKADPLSPADARTRRAIKTCAKLALWLLVSAVVLAALAVLLFVGLWILLWHGM
jgi:hypothetical protein